MLIQRDAMVLQNVLNVITSKVNPEHLRVVLNIVNILLNLFGLVKHHVPGVNDFLDSIKPEMCLARCHIQDLIVSAALLPVCRQHGTLFQAVGAAASYHQWFCVILEIKTRVV